jgi:hypothetical protein
MASASLDSIRNIKTVDNGDGTVSLGVAGAGAGGASQVEGTQATGEPSTANPVLAGLIDGSGNIAPLTDFEGTGALAVAVVFGDVRISEAIRGSGAFDTLQVDVTVASAIIVTGASGCFRMTIQNHDTTNPIYIKNTTVTALNGYRIAAGQSFTFEAQLINDAAYNIHAIAVGGTVRVSVLRQFYPLA